MNVLSNGAKRNLGRHIRYNRGFSRAKIMFKFNSALFAILLLVSETATAQQPDLWWVQAQFQDQSQLQSLRERFQHVSVDRKINTIEVDADSADINWLREQGFVVRIDYAKSAEIQSFLGKELKSIPGFACYRTVEETRTSAASLVTNFPNLAEIVEIGNSWEKTQNAANGYTLQVLKLRNNAVAAPVGGKPKLMMMGSLHAREYPTAELVTQFAEQLLNQYNTNADATWLLDRFEFHLLLHANPDGRKKAENDVEWRKNTNIISAPCGGTPTGSSHSGVDLNRNFPWQWAAGGSFCSQSFAGPSASSEPENAAIVAYERSIFPDLRGSLNSDAAPSDYRGMFLDIHNAFSLVAWPWGNGNGNSGNNAALIALGRRAAFLNNYRPARSDAAGLAFGASDDNAYGEFGVPTLLFELTSGVFFEPCTSFTNNTLPNNLTALRYLARTLWAPYQLALGPNITAVALNNTSVTQGTSVTVTGTINENTQGTVGDGFPASTIPIQGANIFIDALPWDGFAASATATATDGNFNTATENFTATINTTGLSIGRHLIVVQGRNTLSGGTAGAPSALFLTVTASSPNQAPTINAAITLNGNEDIPLPITGYTLSDPDSGGANVTLTLAASAGTLIATASGGVAVSGSGTSNVVLTGSVVSIQNFTNASLVNYSRGLNLSGSATLTSTINDLGNAGTGGALSAQATTTINIAAVNDQPLAVADLPSAINEDVGAQFFAVLGNDTDVENDPITVLSVGAVSPLAAGSVAVGAAGANVVFTPTQNFCGTGVSFNYTINGGSQANVSFNINCINDGPTAVGSLPNIIAIEGTALSVPTAAGFGDVDNPTLSFSVASVPTLPAGITIHPTTGILSGALATGSTGVYALTVTASDAEPLSAQQSFTLTIQPPNLFSDGFE